jgi:hypothetical protein
MGRWRSYLSQGEIDWDNPHVKVDPKAAQYIDWKAKASTKEEIEEFNKKLDSADLSNDEDFIYGKNNQYSWGTGEQTSMPWNAPIENMCNSHSSRTFY